MAGFDALPDGWTVWHDEPGGRAVLVYRPDVFDADAFPAPCLPTLYLTRGPVDRRRPPGEPTGDDRWRVTLTLEPEVTLGEQPVRDDRAAAVEAAVDLAARFAAGELDPRAAYQVPREAYLDRLEALLGR